MARRPRNLVAEYPYHLIVRGNNRQPTFIDDHDRREYRAVLQAAAIEQHVDIHAYVLMSNHVHLLATPHVPDAIAKVMQEVGRRYVRLFNRRHARTGSLWEGRYRSSIVQDDRYLLACQRYIERNPVRAAMVVRPEDYRWSSHRHYLGLDNDALVTPHSLFWALGNTPYEREAAYRALFEASAPADDDVMTRTLLHGRPMADETFLQALERSTGVRWVPRPVGRPRRPGPDRADEVDKPDKPDKPDEPDEPDKPDKITGQ